MKKLKTFLAAISVALVALAGCSNNIEEIAQNSEYGTLVIGKDYRAINVDSIKKAVASVSGNGISTPIVSEAADVANGKGTVVISQIPVGNNRIITVQGYSDSSASEKVDGAVLRAVVNIKAGTNNLDEINWTTSRKGYIYNALFEAGENISELSSEQMSAIAAATPDCDATNINLPLFVEDFKKGYDQLKESSAYILSAEKTLKRLTVEKADSSTEEAPAFNATAYYSDGKTEDVTASAEWESSDSAVATVSGGIVTLVAAGETVVSASYTYGGVTKTGAKQTLTVSSVGSGLAVYVEASYGEVSGGGYIYGWKGASKPYGEWPGTEMKLTSDSNAYYCIIEDTSKIEKLIFNNNNKQSPNLDLPATSGHYLAYYDVDKKTWCWKEYDGIRVTLPEAVLSATVVSEVIYEPLPPTVTISPASGVVSVSNSIVVSYAENNAAVTSASVTLTGAVSKSYSLADFKNKTLTLKLSDLEITEAGKTISVSASATNSEGTATAKATLTTIEKPAVADTFTWDNANVYFVIQDRFYDGDSSNNNSYGRMSKDDLEKTIGTFHGGDIKGLTEKLDYLNNLGVNALWITAPYEQAHGWCGGGSNGDFAHYAYHGYYPLDYTMMDKNMGTVEEFRTFVTECHKRGIRVVMDVVMNHTGYLTLQDCQDYSLNIFKSSFNGGKSTDMGFKIGSDGATYHKHHDNIDYDGHNSEWAKWWGSSWVRAGVPGYTAGGGDDLTKNLDNLPDVKTENTTAQTAAPILQTKWGKETSGYDNWIIPAAKSLRSTTDKNAPAVWIEKWLAAWVEEFGIDGFRCDTAKHVDKYRWGELKALCKTALANWRKSSRADEYAKGWDEEFWMTGEAFGWAKGGDSSWFSNGFDSMIDFTVAKTSGMKTYSPNLPSWENRMGDSQALLYISSHDTGLGRASNQVELGTSFVLMPGLIQIYYGDETSRSFGETGSDENQGTRSDFNWDASTGTTATHWGKLGTFRKFNPAVGAGTGSGTKRSYSGAAGENCVAIGISGTSVDVSGLFSDGTTVYNWYDGKSAVVSGGKVTSFGGGTKNQPILVSDKNPADYGVTF